MSNKHLVHANSNTIINYAPKLPSINRIEFGELAVNFADGYETISLKNDENEIVTFSSDDNLKSYVDDIVGNINDVLDEINGEVI